MASKRGNAKPDDELGELFEGIGGDAPKKTAKSKAAGAQKARTSADKPQKDILADLENQLGEQPERPNTPRVRDQPAPAKRSSTATPPPAADKPVEDKAATATRKSGESTRSYHASFTPSATSSDLQDNEKKGTVEQTAAATGGGWWGGIFNTASATAAAAVKQAESAYKELQKNEDAKKFAEQVRGNVGALKGLKGFGEEFRHRALPTFTNILHTLAPPISSHERLLIHITHDLVGYPSLDPLIYETFSRVMSQVEGGDLLVIQRGHESAFSGSSTAGWRDGPWWRQVDSPRDLGTVKGLIEGTKLCRVSAESFSNEYYSPRGGLEEAQRRALEPVDEENPVRTSDIFLAVQAISVESDSALFAAGSASTAEKEKEKESSAVREEDDRDTQVCFAIYVFDPVHDITYHTVSQSLPVKWIRWLDAPSSPLTPAGSVGEEGAPESTPETSAANVPDEIREIVEGGGVDPREWVAEWIEETLSLSVGVVAQRYVAKRMGVGEAGGFAKGKQKMEDLVQEGGGEAARAGLI